MITKEQARKFIMRYHGILGDYQFQEKEGVMDYFYHISSIQYDPIDVCGKNAEIVLQSRVKGFQKSMLSELLYRDRLLIDYFDKCLCIYPSSDFPYLKNQLMWYYNIELSVDKIKPVCDKMKELITQRGPLCSKDFSMEQKVDWYWKDTKLSRAALEYLYYNCELGISYKKGTIKYYDLIENCIDNPKKLKEYKFSSDKERWKWHVYRRIKSVGLMWDKASDVWLNIAGLNAKNRKQVIQELVSEEKIVPIVIQGCKEPFYIPSTARSILEDIISGERYKKRCELIAPLDSLIWDRKLIEQLFDYKYKWEIYTKKEKREYGYYVLPIVYGYEFIGRIEITLERKKQITKVETVWFEKNVKITQAMRQALDKTVQRFAAFNGCPTVQYFLRKVL